MSQVDSGRAALVFAALVAAGAVAWLALRSHELEARVLALEAATGTLDGATGAASARDPKPVGPAQARRDGPPPSAVGTGNEVRAGEQADPRRAAESPAAASEPASDADLPGPSGGAQEPTSDPLDEASILDAWGLMLPRIRALCAEHDRGSPAAQIRVGLLLDERGGVRRVFTEEDDNPGLAECVATAAANHQFPGTGRSAHGVIDLPWASGGEPARRP